MNSIPYLDVVFISYDEENADANWSRVLEVAPYAQRVHGVKGIFEAHKAASSLATTDMFWVVDGDAEILSSWDFLFQPQLRDRNRIHIWKSINPINGLIYGYGGVKLFPTAAVTNATSWNIDMTTSIGAKLRIVDKISNVTSFNTSPFGTWRSAFRECAKLASEVIEHQVQWETDVRLEAWLNLGKDKQFGKFSIAGAKAGRAYGKQYKDSIEDLKLINDRTWLLEQFNKTKI